MPLIVDSDTHIAESQGMWQTFPPGLYPRRPALVMGPTDTLYGRKNAFWLIDGNIFPKPAGKGGFSLITPSESEFQRSRGDIAIACREGTDVGARLADMDRQGVDVRSEEHTSELQSRPHLVCRLLLEKKKKNNTQHQYRHNRSNTPNTQALRASALHDATSLGQKTRNVAHNS